MIYSLGNVRENRHNKNTVFGYFEGFPAATALITMCKLNNKKTTQNDKQKNTIFGCFEGFSAATALITMCKLTYSVDSFSTDYDSSNWNEFGLSTFD